MKDRDEVLIPKSEIATIRALIDECRSSDDPKNKRILILKLEHLFATRR